MINRLCNLPLKKAAHNKELNTIFLTDENNGYEKRERRKLM